MAVLVGATEPVVKPAAAFVSAHWLHSGSGNSGCNTAVKCTRLGYPELNSIQRIQRMSRKRDRFSFQMAIYSEVPNGLFSSFLSCSHHDNPEAPEFLEDTRCDPQQALCKRVARRPTLKVCPKFANLQDKFMCEKPGQWLTFCIFGDLYNFLCFEDDHKPSTLNSKCLLSKHRCPQR